MSRELALQHELEHLRALNSTVDLLLATVKKVGTDVTVSKKATDNTSGLLEDWTKILNQTKFVNAALRNPQWKGKSEGESDEENGTALQEQELLETELASLEAENERLAKNVHSASPPKKVLKRARR
ncbi:hypothetical protein METBIDRAFT_31957 [Metschnikowia bicuspidata var. bicuspidata NRRL YB-4993]|uniref:DASH complex subunit DUO1 n=1 Tax=Metschnikowia bicuspidata var. bicuspidata NRRL YB-4993 TaxID=869754 RepID=A0A1A0HBC8_9ASCO|nr:hypothetical protein METBIDRAFT_31957 [Metschnikowia bicuspidata var. bicuspidata NRRL YB-4993]OBA21439.1 hypothetical protein METBIDRAFT_31957 [Metschnikowia bicuspidata var. bicuspidata NRRL YB-4993]